jgi:hypothetical protein
MLVKDLGSPQLWSTEGAIDWMIRLVAPRWLGFLAELSKEYTGKLLKDGCFQNEIVSAVTLFDVRTNREFPDPLILLGAQKKHYDI